MSTSFTRGTTPDFRFEVNQDISDWDIYLTFGQRGKDLVTLNNPETAKTEGGCAIVGRLTQEQTLKFKEGEGEAQVRAYKNGAAAANPLKFKFTVYDVLLDGVIPKEARR